MNPCFRRAADDSNVMYVRLPFTGTRGRSIRVRKPSRFALVLFLALPTLGVLAHRLITTIKDAS